jgi:hypothetical protein
MLLTQIKLLEGRLQRDDVYLVLLEGITDRDAAGTGCSKSAASDSQLV